MLNKAQTMRARRLRRSGFTIVELLISVVLIAIVMISTFTFMTSMSNIFYTQDMVVDTQGNLRFALDFMARDIRRSGYLATPAAAVDPLVCPKPSVGVPVRAFSYEDSDNGAHVFGRISPNDNINIEPDSATIIGSFDAPDLFLLDGINGGTAILNAVTTARVLGNGNTSENQVVFQNLFIPGRLVRISDVDSSSQFGVISAASFNGGQPNVTVSGIQVRDGNLGCGLEGVSGQTYEMALLNVIQYQLQQDTHDERKTNLVRVELDARSGQPLRINNGTRQNIVAVLEYAVDLQVMAFGDKLGGRTPVIATDQAGDDAGSLEYTFVDNSVERLSMWHRVRAVQISLSARTPREDVTNAHIPRTRAVGQRGGTVYSPLTSFDIDSDLSSAAHVVTMTTMVELPNLTFANVRGGTP